MLQRYQFCSIVFRLDSKWANKALVQWCLPMRILLIVRHIQATFSCKISSGAGTKVRFRKESAWCTAITFQWTTDWTTCVWLTSMTHMCGTLVPTWPNQTIMCPLPTIPHHQPNRSHQPHQSLHRMTCILLCTGQLFNNYHQNIFSKMRCEFDCLPFTIITFYLLIYLVFGSKYSRGNSGINGSS